MWCGSFFVCVFVCLFVVAGRMLSKNPIFSENTTPAVRGTSRLPPWDVKGRGALLKEGPRRSATPRDPLGRRVWSAYLNSGSDFPQMLIAERDKRGDRINICSSGMEVIKLTPQSSRVLMSFVKHRFFFKFFIFYFERKDQNMWSSALGRCSGA